MADETAVNQPTERNEDNFGSRQKMKNSIRSNGSVCGFQQHVHFQVLFPK